MSSTRYPTAMSSTRYPTTRKYINRTREYINRTRPSQSPISAYGHRKRRTKKKEKMCMCPCHTKKSSASVKRNIDNLHTPSKKISQKEYRRRQSAL
jgi:hypothetical protein